MFFLARFGAVGNFARVLGHSLMGTFEQGIQCLGKSLVIVRTAKSSLAAEFGKLQPAYIALELVYLLSPRALENQILQELADRHTGFDRDAFADSAVFAQMLLYLIAVNDLR